MKNKIQLRYSVREKDWVFDYPDDSGWSLAGVFFEMTKTIGHKIDWQQEFKQMLTERGYDYKTFQITCKKLKQPKDENTI